MKKEICNSFILICRKCKEKSKGNINFMLPFGIYLQCLECNTQEFLGAPQTRQMTKKHQKEVLKYNNN